MKKQLFILSAMCLLLGACDKIEHDKKATTEQASESDNAITQQIKAAISSNPALNIDIKNIRIVSNKGAVTLQGNANSDKQKSAIEALVKAIPGVVSVDNQLEVKNP